MTERILGPHGHDFTPVAEALAPFMGEEIVFIPGPGNAGDALINLGTYAFLDRIGARYMRGDRSRTYAGRVVLHCGGGALVDVYPGGEDILRRHHDTARALILLPHTVRAHGDLIARMDGRCTLFAREAESLDYLRAHRGAARVARAPDMALALSDSDIQAEPWSLRRLLDPEIRGPWLRMVAKFLLHARRDPVLRALRFDVEARGPVPADSMDLTWFFSPGDMSRAHCATAIKAIRLVTAAHERVETDRLHMAILAAIMGKPVTMIDNSYGKNSAMFRASIAGRFPHVRFRHDGAEPARPDGTTRRNAARTRPYAQPARPWQAAGLAESPQRLRSSTAARPTGTAPEKADALPGPAGGGQPGR